jgi:hypothetical protein
LYKIKQDEWVFDEFQNAISYKDPRYKKLKDYIDYVDKNKILTLIVGINEITGNIIIYSENKKEGNLPGIIGHNTMAMKYVNKFGARMPSKTIFIYNDKDIERLKNDLCKTETRGLKFFIKDDNYATINFEPRVMYKAIVKYKEVKRIDDQEWLKRCRVLIDGQLYNVNCYYKDNGEQVQLAEALKINNEIIVTGTPQSIYHPEPTNLEILNIV